MLISKIIILSYAKKTGYTSYSNDVFTKTYFISSLENELLTSNLLQYIIMLRSILAIDSGGHASDLVFARNCSIARMLPGEAELVSE